MNLLTAAYHAQLSTVRLTQSDVYARLPLADVATKKPSLQSLYGFWQRLGGRGAAAAHRRPERRTDSSASGWQRRLASAHRTSQARRRLVTTAATRRGHSGARGPDA